MAVTIIAAFVIGRFTGGGGGHDHSQGSSEAVSESPAESTIWTCSMHPQIRQPKAGKCPICGMTLIPASSGGDDTLNDRELKLTASARKLAEIEVAPVRRRTVMMDVRMVGKVEYDETRLAYLTSWVPGRLDRLFVDYTGVPVKKGDHMVYIYSPEIRTAQEELLQAVEAVRKLAKSNVEIVRQSAAATVEASREKLRLWGLTDEQIAAAEISGKPTDHITIYAPIGGIVIHKNALEGSYVQTGTKIYTIADLEHVWVKLDAYESDLPWLRYGQEVEFHTEAYPGEIFRGRIAFIDPILNEKTRTAKVRVNVSNPDGKLKPNMFVRAVVQASIAEGGKVIDAALTGKWISPMHPEIVKDGPGSCDVCGMPLVKAESLGFVPPDMIDAAAPLVIPSSAPLITGKKAVVYVQSPDDPSRFEGRIVVLGARAGDHYVVESGLDEGEQVVVNGNFKIDSALQIQARSSMMSPPEPEGRASRGTGDGARKTGSAAFTDIPEDFGRQLEAALSAYLLIHDNLSKDNFKEAQQAAQAFLTRLEAIDMKILSDKPHMTWMTVNSELKRSADMILEANEIEAGRTGFKELSEASTGAIRRFGSGLTGKIVQMKCPMAFNNTGGIWLQNQDTVANPYLGSAMLRCGEVVEVLTSGSELREAPSMQPNAEDNEEQEHEGSHMHEGSHH